MKMIVLIAFSCTRTRTKMILRRRIE